MDGEPIFVDTNVLIYGSRAAHPFHEASVAALPNARDRGCIIWISRQILREYLAVVTRPQPNIPPLALADACSDVRTFIEDMNIAEDGAKVTEYLLTLLARHPSAGKQIHDANIVATMLTYGLRRLLTFNAADFRRFAAVIDLLPLPA